MIYSTHDVHPRERLSYWLEVATRGYVEHEFHTPVGQAFQGRLKVASLPGVGLSTFEADPHRAVRPDRHHEDSGDILVSMLSRGKVSVFQDGRESSIENRGLYLIDPIRPFEVLVSEPSTHIIVKIPRPMLEARVGNTADLTARSITQSNGIGALTLGFLDLLPEHAESLDAVAGLKVAEQMLDLVALALTAAGRDKGPALSSPRAVALLRLKATIERLLIEPGLRPERIAGETGISVRYANSLLAEENWSMERYLTERRLERCRKALEDPAQAHRSIGEIAFKWGFSDLSHFGRRFKTRYGYTPTDYRRHAEQKAAERRPYANEARNAVRPRAGHFRVKEFT